ncbi:prosaposin-like isoform X2 [Lissotriton helveticus]
MAGPMAALLILPLMLHTATAGTGLEQARLEIPKLCQQGPEYWCQSDETASLCMKEDFCMELWLNALTEALIGSGAEEYAEGLKEWKRKDGTHPLRSHWGGLCTACKSVFDFLKRHVANDQNDSEISRALDIACDSFSFFIRWPCRWLLKIYRKAIMKAFEEHKDAASMCASLRLCRRASFRNLRSDSPPGVTAGTGVEQGHLEIPKLCQQGPQYWCQSDETASLCMKEDFCMELWQNAPAEALIGSGAEDYAGGLKEWRRKNGTNLLHGDWGFRCTACKYVFSFLKKNVANNQSDEEISRALDGLCNTVFFLIRTPCKMGIRRFKTAIMKAFKGHQDSATFCANVHLCSEAAGTGVELVDLESPKLCQQGPEYWCQSDETASLCMKEDFCVELWQNAPAEILIGSGAGESAGSLEAPFGENKEWRRNDGTNQLRGSWGLKCMACKYVFKFLGKHLRDYKSNEDISSALDKVCKKVSILLRIPCKLVIRRYRKAIIQAIDMHEDSATFCANVHLCSRAEETDVELSYQEDPKLCLQGSEYWCQSEETASLCKKEDYCMELWQNVPAELEASSHGDPEGATEEEEEKRKKDKKNKKEKKGKKGKKNKKRKDKTDVKCSGCTLIVTNLQKTVGENLDDDTVNGAVDSMCDEVDDSISEICTTMKENNKDGLVEAVKNGDSRKDICTQIQMCAPVPAPSVGPTCIFCQAFISFVKPLLTDNVHKKDTGPVLADLCMEHFGNSTTCNNFLSTYGPMVKHVLLKPWDEVTTCQEVGACEAGLPMPQFDVKRAASRRKDLEDTGSTQLVMVNA